MYGDFGGLVFGEGFFFLFCLLAFGLGFFVVFFVVMVVGFSF